MNFFVDTYCCSAYVPAGKYFYQHPCIDIGDGAGTTTNSTDLTLQKLNSNIGNFGTSGLSASLVHHHRSRFMIVAAEVLGKAVNSMASAFRVVKSTQFVYTPSNASSMRDPDFKLELIKVRITMFGTLGLQPQMQQRRIASNDLFAGLSARLL